MLRVGITLGLLTVVAAACGTPPARESAETPSTQANTGSLPVGPSALRDFTSAEFPPPLVDVTEIRSGGPPPDGIPSIDGPVFVSQQDGDAWLHPDEAVMIVEIGGDARAYPAQVMIWHEIVNDTVGGVPVVVTYCPLCNSAVAYERTIDGVVTTFGTSGSLFNSALVMYDRATESLWTHYDGRAVVGMLAGRQLEVIPAPLMTWADFKEAYPEGVALDRTATGYVRDYGRNPYAGYDDPDGRPFLFGGVVDDRASAMQRVVGITIGEDSVAWTLDAISSGSAQATNTEVDGQPVVILWKAGQRSALEEDGVEEGRDVGSVAVFEPVVDGRPLTFEASSNGFVDQQTGSIWDIAGRAVSGPMSGATLDRIAHLDTFWFAWSTYRPGTRLESG